MEVIIKHIIERCADCPYASNSAREHDDPFSSSPFNPIWFCNYTPHSRRNVYIPDAINKIADDCPLKDKSIEEINYVNLCQS